jgi:polysaccharide pyruvyl transferase CsaB
MSRPLRFLLSGYYGFGNAGDEAVLSGIVERLRSDYPDADITVLSADPAATANTHGVAAVQRWRLASVWSALGRCDVLLQGGGSLIQDVTSRLSAVYYLGVLRLARLRRVPTVILAQGLGPLRNPVLRAWTRREFRAAAAVTVRDQDSLDELGRLGVTSPSPVLVADPALLMTPRRHGSATADAAPRAVIAARDWPGAAGAHASCRALARWLWESRGLEVDVVAFQDPGDVTLARDISEASVGCRLVSGLGHPADIVTLVARADLVVAMRLHGLILAAAQCVPAVGISYDPKVSAFGAAAGQPVLGLRECTPETLITACEQALEQADALAGQRRETAEGLRAAAGESFQMVREVTRRLGRV